MAGSAMALKKAPLKPQATGAKKQGDAQRNLYAGAVVAAVAAFAAFYNLFPSHVGPGKCGDGICGWGETARSCAVDCAGRCGDGFCSMQESCARDERDSDSTACREDCGRCSIPEWSQCSADGLPSAQHNASYLWGTYRPHLFLGLRTRSPKPVIAGLMWHDATGVEPMRYAPPEPPVRSSRQREQLIPAPRGRVQVRGDIERHRQVRLGAPRRGVVWAPDHPGAPPRAAHRRPAQRCC